MSLVERSKDWIRQAKRDLEAAEHQLAGGFYEWACFLAQQAAEKAVKAVFQKLGAEAFGHSVAGLLSSLPEELRPGEDLMDLAKELDKAYIPTRYPNAHPEGAPCELYTRAEAERLIGYAGRIIELCENLLSKI
ncbi:MAG: HEPN domain-containing protein [Nitrososphaerota archaeon]